MATEREVIREFLVSLGFHVEPVSARRFLDTLTSTCKAATKVGTAVVAVAAAAEVMVQTFARGMEKMYYASQRTKASVSSLKAVEFAFSQIGLTSDDALEAVESLSRGLRMNPGLQAFLESMGVKTTGQDRVKVLFEAVKALSKLPHFVGAQWAEQLGISEKTFLHMKEHMGELEAAYERRLQMVKETGLDEKAAAEASKQYMNALRELGERIEVIWGRVSVALLPTFLEMNRQVNEILTVIQGWIGSGFDVELGEWKTQIHSIGEELKTMWSMLTLFRDMFKGDEFPRINALFWTLSHSIRAAAHALLDLVDAQVALLTGNWGKAYEKLKSVAKYLVLGPGTPESEEERKANAMFRGQGGATPNASYNRARQGFMDVGPRVPTPTSTATSGAATNAARLFASLEEAYGLPAGLLDRMWSKESARGTNMLSKKGAMGHFQFMPPTAERFGLTDPNDLQASATAAAQYMNVLLRMFDGNLEKALAGYNWGEGNVQRRGLGAAPPETLDYMKMARGLEVNAPTTINVHGGGDPRAVAKATGDEQARVYSELLRNARGVLQ